MASSMQLARKACSVRTVICCKWSCITCRAFVTRSSEPCCCCSWAPEKGRCMIRRFREQKAAGRSSLIRAERWRRLWRVRKTSALVNGRGQRLDNHRTSRVCPFLFVVLGVSLFHVFSCAARRPHCVSSIHLHAFHRGACRQGDAPLDRFPSFAFCLSS